MKQYVWLLVAAIAVTVAGAVAAGAGCGAASNCLFLPLVSTQAVSRTSGPSPQPSPPSATPTTNPQAPSATPTTNPPTPSATPTTNPNPQQIVGLAILGDSTQDEYQADNPRGGEYNPVTFNWVEQLYIARKINLGAWGTRAEPRRSGFAFNWTRSGATSDQMISYGQHTGAAEQVMNGEVSHALIQIGINDFYYSGLALAIYDGSMIDAEVKNRLDQIANNIITAARTLKQTNRCAVIIAATQDYMTLPVVPELDETYQDPVGRQRFVDAVAYLNGQLKQASAAEGVSFFDFNATYLAEIEGRLDADGFLIVGGVKIDLNTRGDSPYFGLIDDGYIHPGTVLSGLYAKVYIEEMNRAFGTAITPLTDAEILAHAGILP